MVVELDEERLEKLLRRFAGQAPIRQPTLVERQQVLVQVTRVEGVPPVELRDHTQVAEPVVLKRLVEVARLVRRDVPAGGRDPLEHPSLGGIALGKRLDLREIRMPFGEPNQRVTRDPHRLQGLALVLCLGVHGEVQAAEGSVDVRLEAPHPLRVDLVIEHRVPGRPLLHEFGEHPGFVGVVPLVRKRREQAISERAAGPEGDHGALVVGDRGVRHRVAGLGPRIEDSQVFDGMTGQLRKRRHGLGLRTPFAHDQLAVSVVQRLVLAQVEEGSRPQDRRGQATEVLLVERRDQQRSLGGNARYRFEALLPQPSCSIRHSVILRLP